MSQRIAIFLPNMGRGEEGGGAQRNLAILASYLAGTNRPVDVVLARAQGPYLSELSPKVRIVDLKAGHFSKSLFGLIRYLWQAKPDVLLSSLPHADIFALIASRFSKKRIRTIIRIANTISVNQAEPTLLAMRLIHRLRPLIYPWADHYVAVSQGVADDLIKSFSVPKDKVEVIYNPVITPNLKALSEELCEHPWFLPDQPPVVLSVGRLYPQKNHALLIRAFAAVRRQASARLVILGEGPERATLERLVQELGLEQDVELAGFKKNPFKYMRNADLFVLSSSWEGLPNVLIQAMACGCPVVSTDCPSGPREILAEGKYGRLVPVDDVSSLASAIQANLHSNHEPVDRSWLEQFEMESVGCQYVDLLKRAMLTIPHRRLVSYE